MGAFRLLLLISAAVLVVSAKYNEVNSVTNDEHHLDIRVDDHGEVTSEAIDINYKRKYVKISSPRQHGAQSGSLLHDYTQGLNVLKQHGECFILDSLRGIPADIKDWERVESSVSSDVIPDNGRHAHFGYKALSYLVNRTTTPESVQEFCPGPIRVVVLKEQDDDVKNDESRDERESSETRVEMGDNEEYLPTDIFIPHALVPRDIPHLREKRWIKIRINIRIRITIRF